MSQLLHSPLFAQTQLHLQSPLWRGLELWIDANARHKAVAFDLSQRRRHGEIINSPIRAATPWGLGFRLTSANFVTVADTPALRAVPMTIEVAIYRPADWSVAGPGGFSGLVAKSNFFSAGWEIGYGITAEGSQAQATIDVAAYSSSLGGTICRASSNGPILQPVLPRTRSHVVLILTASSGEVYIDGVFWTLFSLSPSFAVSNIDMQIGNARSYLGNTQADCVQRLRCWSRVLSAQEIRALAHDGVTDPMRVPDFLHGRAPQIVSTPATPPPAIGPVSAAPGDPDAGMGSFVLGWPGLTVDFTSLVTALGFALDVRAGLVHEISLQTSVGLTLDVRGTAGLLEPLTTTMVGQFDVRFAVSAILSQSLSSSLGLFLDVRVTLIQNQVLFHVDFEPLNFGEFPGGMEGAS